MADARAAELVIPGITLDGQALRPGDWPERLCGLLGASGSDHRIRYSPFVHRITVNGGHSAVADSVRAKLQRVGDTA
ncbi:MAG: DUF3579 domain-containing protein [Burkholderiales bacterium]